MGIEPTDRMLYTRPSGFEDRGGHQPAKHFRTKFYRVLLFACCGVVFSDTRLTPVFASATIPRTAKDTRPVVTNGCHVTPPNL